MSHHADPNGYGHATDKPSAKYGYKTSIKQRRIKGGLYDFFFRCAKMRASEFKWWLAYLNTILAARTPHTPLPRGEVQ